MRNLTSCKLALLHAHVNKVSMPEPGSRVPTVSEATLQGSSSVEGLMYGHPSLSERIM